MKLRFYLGTLFSLCILCSLLLVACNGPTDTTFTGSTTSTPSSSNPQAVMVKLTDTTVSSSLLTFSANRAYDFTIVNNGKSPHDFIIRRRSESFSPTGQGNQGILHIIAALPPGKTVKFTYSFPTATIKSTVQFEEHLAGVDQQSGPVTPIQVVQAR